MELAIFLGAIGVIFIVGATAGLRSAFFVSGFLMVLWSVQLVISQIFNEFVCSETETTTGCVHQAAIAVSSTAAFFAHFVEGEILGSLFGVGTLVFLGMLLGMSVMGWVDFSNWRRQDDSRQDEPGYDL